MSMEKDQDNEPYEPSDSEWYLEDLVDHRTDDMDYVDYEEEGGGVDVEADASADGRQKLSTGLERSWG